MSGFIGGGLARSYFIGQVIDLPYLPDPMPRGFALWDGEVHAITDAPRLFAKIGQSFRRDDDTYDTSTHFRFGGGQVLRRGAVIGSGGGGPITIYPLDATPPGPFTQFPDVAGSTHGFTFAEGSGAGALYVAWPESVVNGIGGGQQIGDLLIPAAGIVAAEFVLETDATGQPQPNGNSGIIAEMQFAAADASVEFVLTIPFMNSNSQQSTRLICGYTSTPPQPEDFSFDSGAQPLAVPGTTRVTIYIDGATRQIGVVLNGVDLGWLPHPVTTDPIVIPLAVTALAIGKTGNFTNIQAGDAVIGSTMTCTHNIDPATMVDAGLLPAAPQEWELLGGEQGNIGTRSGSNSTGGHALTAAQMPAHRHMVANFNNPAVNPETSNLSPTNALARLNVTGGESNAHIGGVEAEADVGMSSEAGEGEAHSHTVEPLADNMVFLVRI